MMTWGTVLLLLALGVVLLWAATGAPLPREVWWLTYASALVGTALVIVAIGPQNLLL